ncbi:RNA polymerase II fourth largest subunit [Spathaspora passalidarum NRRL Y-27907]|uniref:RNA polymerase II fourth largest subunit n=1 Tax=Spathaspora passalidarum (strain NRRL Y-27907 / 11-Y1) TaxID=619300 RepID=G3AL06_SPAPN|nr:RNA polymerase II fourth largest subunit [Spathaspora passalidarum NRRL Y-27907]EGW33049.1 RNA polymerase II fourth largest subunit [Spathaspora passalidarum NRRL Y-27907]
MNVSTSALGVRRRKAKAASQNIDDEENAAILKLGPEFQLTQITNSGEEEQLIALNLSEARLLIRAALKERKNKNKGKQQQAQQSASQSTQSPDQDEDDKEDEISNMELAGPNSNEIMHKTLNYLSNFARFKNSSSTETVEKLLNDFSLSAIEPLHPFELAQLGTLECEDAEEAKSLIPSLANKVSDVQLQTLLTELRKYQTLS